MKMNHYSCFVTLWIAFLLGSCKERDSVENRLAKFESGWTVAGAYKSDGRIHDQQPVQIAEGTTVLNGFPVQMMLLMSDSRGTEMDYASWERFLLGTNLSLEERMKKKIAMQGESGTIYPFGGNNCNKGFFVIVRNAPVAWAEIWDSQGKKRVRMQFPVRTPGDGDSAGIIARLAVMQWTDARPETDRRDVPNTAIDPKVGGLYTYANNEGKYEIVKILALDDVSVHARYYSESFSEPPTSVSSAKLTPLIGYVALNRNGFIKGDGKLILINVESVSDKELEGYRPRAKTMKIPLH